MRDAPATLLVIDDEPLILDSFRLLFPKGQVRVVTARSAEEGIKAFRESEPDAVTLDIQLPDGSGLKTFKDLRNISRKVPVVLITGYGTADTAIEAMRLGAFDYVLKPLDPDPLRALLMRAFETRRLMNVPATLPSANEPTGNADVLIGTSPAIQDVYKSIGRVAQTDATVLILGESGTGKELVARAIYHYSNRSAGPFLAVNCAAIPEPLLESELFGHEKGAFTGASRRRAGKFEQCDGGTLFLDEIGEMTPLTQAKMLRVLQEKAVQRVGGNELIHTDVRVVAATNRDLEAMVAAGRFRQDLFYRLNVYMIRLSPLRERGDDIVLLARHFVRRFARELGRDTFEIHDNAMAMLRGYHWPGNVRELQSMLKKALLNAAGPTLLPENLLLALHAGKPMEVPTLKPSASPDLNEFIAGRLAANSIDLYAEYLALVERPLFLSVLRHTNYNLSQAAQILGISRTTLRTRLAALGITLEKSATVEEE